MSGSPDIEVVDRARCDVGESIVWDHRSGVLWWCDVRGRSIFRLDPATGERRTWKFAEKVGAVALRAKGGVIVALRSGLYAFDPSTGLLDSLAAPELDRPENRFNDGKVDRSGNFWCGTMPDLTPAPDGRLWRFTADLQTQSFIDGLTCPNGLCWSPDGGTMYFTDSFRRCIDVFAFDLAAGPHDRRLFAEISSGRGIPDGATVDAEGFLWSANFDGGAITRYAPDGRIDRVVDLPVQRPTCCGFGGAGLNVLYVTTATHGLTAAELIERPMSGCVLALRPGVHGLAEPEFAG